MKTVKKWLSNALLLSILSSSMVMAQGGPYYEEKTFAVAVYPAIEPLKIWLNIERTTMLGTVRVDMCDRQGHVLFSEWLPKKDARFHQLFDLSSIGDGTYTFVITDGVQRQERTFRLHTPGLEEQLPHRLVTMK